MERKSFLDQEPPPNYIPGIGRGATGFSTQAGLGSIGSKRFNTPTTGDNDTDTNQDRYADADTGEDYGFDKDNLGGDDVEADKIYDEIEKRLQMRKRKPAIKKRRASSELVESNNTESNEKLKVEDISIGESIKTISEQFKNYKRELSKVSEEDWLNLPESGDFTKRNKRKRKETQEQQRFYRNSDTFITEMRDSDQDTQDKLDDGDLEGKADLTSVSLAKDKVLASQLASLRNGNSSSTYLDSSVYLKQLSSIDEADENSILETSTKITSNVGDYHKNRVIFKKMRESSPHKPGSWIASARMEYEVKKYDRAKRLIQEGCEKCPKSEEVWLVNLEINHADLATCRGIVAEALKYNSKSLKLWSKAIELQNDNSSKKRILRRALESLPKSQTLWLEILNYEENTEMAEKMLQKATELLPTSIDLWLALTKLQSFENAKKTLNKARKLVNKEHIHLIYIEGAKLEESNTENEIKVNKMIKKCFKEAGEQVSRDDYLNIAVDCETNGFIMTAKAITLNSTSIGFNDETQKDEDKLEIWQQDAQFAYANNNIEIARSIYMFITSNYPNDLKTWDAFINMEKSLSDYKALYTVYEMEITANPQEERYYLMYAKDKWVLDNDIEKAREILSEGLNKNSEFEDLWFAAIKLEWKSGSKLQAIQLFETCRSEIKETSSRIWYKNVTLERQQGNTETALRLIDEGLAYHPTEPKLYLQMGQIYEDLQNWEKARESYESGTKICHDSGLLWVHWSRIEEFKLKRMVKARSILDQGLAINPKDELIYLERIKLETRAKNNQQAQILISRAIRELPKSGLIWSEHIKLAKPQQRKNLYKQALNSTNDDNYVVLTIALDLWSLGKIARSKQFFDSVLEKDPDFGDYYIHYYRFLLKHGSGDDIKDLKNKLVKNEPRHGYQWCSIFKKLENLDKDPLDLLCDESIYVE